MGPARPLSGESGISPGRILDMSASAASASSQEANGKAIRRLYSHEANNQLTAMGVQALAVNPSIHEAQIISSKSVINSKKKCFKFRKNFSINIRW
jgi:hypothetical protein